MIKEKFIKPKDENIEKFISKLEKKLDMTLIAKTSESEVNGYFTTKQEGGDTIVEIHLYDDDEPTNYFEGVYKNIPYNHGHKTSFVKAKGDLKDLLTATKGKVDHDII